MKREKILARIAGDLKDAIGLLGEMNCKDADQKELLTRKLASLLKFAECQQDMIQKAFTSVDYSPIHLDGIELVERLILLSQEKNEAEFTAGAAKHLAEAVKTQLAEEMKKENLFRLFCRGLGYSAIFNDGTISLYHDVDGIEQKIDI